MKFEQGTNEVITWDLKNKIACHVCVKKLTNMTNVSYDYSLQIMYHLQSQ